MTRPRRLLCTALALVLLAAIAPATARAAPPTNLDQITMAEGFRQPHADILRLYYAIFDRAPDVGGAAFWIDRYDRGESIERIADQMSQSPEFVALYGETTNQRFVEALYQNVLDRPPDTNGFAFWVSGLDRGVFARLWVLRHFADSSEFVADHRFVGEEDAPAGPPLTRPVGTGGSIRGVSVEVEDALGWDDHEAKEAVMAILGDGRSWIAEGDVRFQLVDPADADVRVRIATPATVDARCFPLRTVGRLSCRNGNSLNINSDRWTGATSFWTAPLDEYRAYVINHEMGHFLGLGHQNCPGAGQLAPVMQQQTKSLRGCQPNGWPYPNGTHS